MAATVVSPGEHQHGPLEMKVSDLIKVSHITFIKVHDGSVTDSQNQDPTQSRDPSPSRGSSLPEFQAIGSEHEKKSAWLREREIDCSSRVKITKLSHMRYQHPDLLEITKFLRSKPWVFVYYGFSSIALS